ncbi:hypothetical protein E2C01_040566 [Portunus trituberculatus]|uniref:Uncharacterized protein n=1 Tax=Portunus trituberculatus TaxID=210409 RepID=A0A5B7FMU9_PORTR|nr:hypothetical protein [Portunus trituberculatus]
MHRYSRNSASAAGTAERTPLLQRCRHHESVCSRHFTPLPRISSTHPHPPPQRHITALVLAASKSCRCVPAWLARQVGQLGGERDTFTNYLFV